MNVERPSVWPWFVAVFALVGLDQYTKYLVRQNFDLGESVRLIGDDFLRLTFVLNPGVAFGLPVPWKTTLLVFGWAAAVMLAVYLFGLIRDRSIYRIPVMLFLAGAIGNSIDRLLFREVTDFVDVDFPDFIMDRWPVFNVADSCVTIGVVLLFTLILLHQRKNGSPEIGSLETDNDSRISSESKEGTQALSSHDSSGTATGTH